MSRPSNPSWFGRRYPLWNDLIGYVEGLGCLIGFADLGSQALFVPGSQAEPPVILLPHDQGLLGHWLLAHELAHLRLHSGYTGPRSRDKQEAQAYRWAACALIPEARIRNHMNASEDAFIAALSVHYEDIPLESCGLRELAHTISRHRLKALLEVA